MADILKSKRASAVPGSTLRVLIAPAKDSLGYVWPAGTTFNPQSSGRDANRRYQDVTIGKLKVRFYA